MKVRKICFVLAVLMLASAFAAGCGQSAAEPAVSPAAAVETTPPPEPTAQAEEEKKELPPPGVFVCGRCLRRQQVSSECAEHRKSAA